MSSRYQRHISPRITQHDPKLAIKEKEKKIINTTSNNVFAKEKQVVKHV